MAKKINLDEIDESLIIAAVKKDRNSVPDNPERLLQPAPAKTTAQTGKVTDGSGIGGSGIDETRMGVTKIDEIGIGETRIGKTMESVAPPEPPKEEGKRKRKPQDYEGLFIRESNVTARLGKTVYIRKEFHDRILKIVQVVGGNELSLFSYIDNVLAHHFENFQEEISQAYRQRVSNDLF